MSSELSPEYMNEIVTESVKEIMEQVTAAADAQMGPDGETFGMVQAEGAEFIAAYLDLQSRIVVIQTPLGPVQGEMRRLDRLRVIAPKFAEKLDSQFERELRRQAERVA